MFLDSRILLMGLVMGGLVACSPKTTYENFISDQGYIPFQQPLSQVGVGALLAGSPDQLRIISPSKTCFPTAYNGADTQLYQSVDAQLPEISKKMSISAGMDANFLAASGTPLFRLKTSYTQLKTLDVHIDGASIEYLDEIAFGMWVYSGMSEACRAYLQNGGSFIRQALRVDKMLFQFKNSKGGLIAINTDKIKEIMDFEVDVKWEIVDNYTMSITSPKYVGYHLAKVNPQSPGSIAYIASDLTKKGEFDFKPVQSYTSYEGLMSSY
ncbi:hypothetical protein [Bdellovibrio sp. KM01]|uniref:hypothetical protein n=1 Tax=Bdellovibrio sp. KM01 TaxID=2748865 RepID=UPI0015EAC26B|nr:hypothetical protein [Bdellovibrio sp. KM01]QLY26525.1 hypothetical protein HW988_05750 [Bdellovibrio sp. KM01]